MRRDAASSTRYRPDVVVFDVVETLFSLDRVADALQEVGQAPELLDGFFLRLLRDGLSTGWASRLEGTGSPVFTPPDIVGGDLVEVIDGLLALPVPPT